MLKLYIIATIVSLALMPQGAYAMGDLPDTNSAPTEVESEHEIIPIRIGGEGKYGIMSNEEIAQDISAIDEALNSDCVPAAQKRDLRKIKRELLKEQRKRAQNTSFIETINPLDDASGPDNGFDPVLW